MSGGSSPPPPPSHTPLTISYLFEDTDEEPEGDEGPVVRREGDCDTECDLGPDRNEPDRLPSVTIRELSKDEGSDHDTAHED